jgi:predicted Rossmann-fold nucleotide-binding protein
VPVVLVGKEYWGGLLEWLEKIVYSDFDNINREDLKIFQLVDTAPEAYEIIKISEERSFF